MESGEYFAKQAERRKKKSEDHEAKIQKNTEVSLQRKKEKREKEFQPPVEKSIQVKPKKTVEGTTDSLVFLFHHFVIFHCRYEQIGEKCQEKSQTFAGRLKTHCEKSFSSFRKKNCCCFVIPLFQSIR